MAFYKMYYTLKLIDVQKWCRMTPLIPYLIVITQEFIFKSIASIAVAMFFSVGEKRKDHKGNKMVSILHLFNQDHYAGKQSFQGLSSMRLGGIELIWYGHASHVDSHMGNSVHTWFYLMPWAPSLGVTISLKVCMFCIQV